MKRVFLIFVLCFSFLLWGTVAFAIPLDLSTFIAVPNDPNIVNIDTDTDTITFDENFDYGFIYAANDSFVVPDNATNLTYTYSLTPGFDDYDWLVAVINYNNYVMEIGQTGSGSWIIDMTSFQGQMISLAFGLEYDWDYDSGYDSIGTISNIDLATAAPVPEPATILLLGTGLAGLAGIRRKRKNKTAT